MNDTETEQFYKLGVKEGLKGDEPRTAFPNDPEGHFLRRYQRGHRDGRALRKIESE